MFDSLKDYSLDKKIDIAYEFKRFCETGQGGNELNSVLGLSTFSKSILKEKPVEAFTDDERRFVIDAVYSWLEGEIQDSIKNETIINEAEETLRDFRKSTHSINKIDDSQSKKQEVENEFDGFVDSEIDSKYRLILIAAQRSKQLQRGAHTRVDADPRRTKPKRITMVENKKNRLNTKSIKEK